MRNVVISGHKTKEDAVGHFFDVLLMHQERIEATLAKVEKIYRMETPDSPYFEYDFEIIHANQKPDFGYELSAWVENDRDRALDDSMQSIVFDLESLPFNDHVPSVRVGTDYSDLIPSLFGIEFDYTKEGAVLNRNYAIHDLARDLDSLPTINVLEMQSVQEILSLTRFWEDAFEGRVQITYPQMQGPLTNAARMMDQTDMLVACARDKKNMRNLVGIITRIIVDIIKAMHDVVSDPMLLRPRRRFWQPDTVRGLLVDDYISVINPDDYFDICQEAWQMMYDEVGPIYLHTCGPILQCAELYKKLPGLAGGETAFINGQNTTTRDIESMKTSLNGSSVLCTFGLPLGQPVGDMENFTRGWMEEVSRGGGVLLGATGSLECGEKLFKRLEMA